MSNAHFLHSYIVAGALMASDDDGFVTLDPNSDGRQGALNVVEFAQVRVQSTNNRVYIISEIDVSQAHYHAIN